MQHPAYKGEAVAWRWTRQTKPHGTPTLRPVEDWIRLPDGVVPPIVPPELWQQAHDAMRAQHGEATRNEQRPSLLRGHIWCSVCGKRMQPMRENSTSAHPQRIYRCSSRDTASGACGGKRVPAEAVEAEVWERIVARLRNPDTIADELKRQEEDGPDPILTDDLDKARREVARCEHEQRKLVAKLRAAEDSTSRMWKLVEEEVDALEAEREQWQNTITQIEGRLADQQLDEQQLVALRDWCARVGKKLDRAGFAEQRDALQALNVRVEANGRDSAQWRIRGRIDLAAGEVSLEPTTSECYVHLRPPPPARA